MVRTPTARESGGLDGRDGAREIRERLVEPAGVGPWALDALGQFGLGVWAAQWALRPRPPEERRHVDDDATA